MNIQFQSEGIRYHFQWGLRWPAADDIEILPDKALWTTAQKKRAMAHEALRDVAVAISSLKRELS